MVQWHSDQRDQSDRCRQEWFKKTKHSYLLRKVDKWKVWTPPPPLDLTWLQPTLLAGCQHPLWLDGNQLIGEAQDWKKRGLETKKMENGFGERGKKKLMRKRRKTTLEAISVSCFILFCCRTRTEKNAWENFSYVVIWFILSSVYSLTLSSSFAYTFPLFNSSLIHPISSINLLLFL